MPSRMNRTMRIRDRDGMTSFLDEAMAVRDSGGCRLRPARRTGGDGSSIGMRFVADLRKRLSKGSRSVHRCCWNGAVVRFAGPLRAIGARTDRLTYGHDDDRHLPVRRLPARPPGA